MSQKTFHIAFWNGVSAGDTYRIFDGAYGTATVLGFAPKANPHDDVYVRLARPYCFASSVGTTAPTPLCGVEVFEITFARLQDHKPYEGSPMVVKP